MTTNPVRTTQDESLLPAERENWIALRTKARQLCEAARDHEGVARLFYINEAIEELSPLRVVSPTKDRIDAE